MHGSTLHAGVVAANVLAATLQPYNRRATHRLGALRRSVGLADEKIAMRRRIRPWRRVIGGTALCLAMAGLVGCDGSRGPQGGGSSPSAAVSYCQQPDGLGDNQSLGQSGFGSNSDCISQIDMAAQAEHVNVATYIQQLGG